MKIIVSIKINNWHTQIYSYKSELLYFPYFKKHTFLEHLIN